MEEKRQKFLRSLPWYLRRARACEHMEAVKEVTPRSTGCEECLQMGDTWEELRLCMECGHVGCCDQSKNRHASKHFHETGHPVIQSLQPNESWRWCYIDEVKQV